MRPEGLNTVHLLRLASQQIGLGPQSTMHVAERLYLGGFLTYPRTESTRYPPNFDVDGVVAALASYPLSIEVQQHASSLIQGALVRARPGKDEVSILQTKTIYILNFISFLNTKKIQGDHPPITPTNKSPRNLGRDE